MQSSIESVLPNARSRHTGLKAAPMWKIMQMTPASMNKTLDPGLEHM